MKGIKGKSPNAASEERRYIKLSDAEANKTEGLGFPDEYFEDEEPEEFEDFLLGLDDDEAARKAKNESVIGKICFVSGAVVIGAVLIGALVFASRLFMLKIINKFD